MTEVGRRVALGEQAARLLELQRGLERGRVVVAARDDDRAFGGRELRDDLRVVVDGRGRRRKRRLQDVRQPAEGAARAPSGARPATSAAPAASWATYDFVAATDRSSPARQSMTCSAAAASGDAASLAIAMVVAPAARAASTTAIRSGDRPDCDTAMTSPPRQRTSAP